MQKNFVPIMVSISLFTLGIIVVCAVISIIYCAYAGFTNNSDVFTARFFFTTLANTMFFAGGIVLTFGAFAELFARSKSSIIAKGLLRSYELLYGKSLEPTEEPRSGGWLLVFIGALTILISAAAAIISMK